MNAGRQVPGSRRVLTWILVGADAPWQVRARGVRDDGLAAGLDPGRVGRSRTATQTVKRSSAVTWLFYALPVPLHSPAPAKGRRVNHS